VRRRRELREGADPVYSELAGVPVALLGLLGYTAILGLLIPMTAAQTSSRRGSQRAAGVPGRTAIDTLRRHAPAGTVVLLEAAAELMSSRRPAWNVPRRSADSSSRQSLWLL
jgi:hypothetical protein